jgi:hypothetical protein
MGGKESKEAAPVPSIPTDAAPAQQVQSIDGGATPENTGLNRYRVARPETLEMLRESQTPVGKRGTPLPPGFNKEVQEYIRETEGLNMGERRLSELAQQWRFYLSCEPIQRGMDAGIVLGSITGAASMYWPKWRNPVSVGLFWFGGFAVGMVTFPMALVWHEIRNMNRIQAKEHEMFQQQRQDYRQGKGGAAGGLM